MNKLFASDFGAFVVEVLFTRFGAAFVMADGSVRFASGESFEAHDGAALCAVAHPSGEGVISGGDDGKVMLTTPAGSTELADLGGKWIDALAVSGDSNLLAFATGREVHVRDLKDAAFQRRFAHERAVASLSFDPKGRRLACATYGGVVLWYARIAEQKPQMLKWAGSHVLVRYSPDGRFIMSSMQENALHGWRVADNKDMRMGGYPAKVKSLAFMSKGALMATSGAPGVVVWPFAGANGPMGKDAVEIGVDESSLVLRTAGEAAGSRLAAGLSDGRVWTCDLKGAGIDYLKAEKGAPISALAVSDDGRLVAYGDEEGGAAVVQVG
jgi:WD40 repeat protein